MTQLEKAAQNENSMVSFLAELESQSACPYIGDCKIVKEFGLKPYCGDYGSFCSERMKRDEKAN